MSSSGIYRIRNSVTGDQYVGSSSEIEFRFGRHRYDLERNQHINPKLQNAWNKYGAENFVFEVIELCDRSSLLVCEQTYLDDRPTYNIAVHADRPPSRLGIRRQHSDETKQKISRSKLGHEVTSEAREKMSRARRGRTWEEIYGVEAANELRRRRRTEVEQG